MSPGHKVNKVTEENQDPLGLRDQLEELAKEVNQDRLDQLVKGDQRVKLGQQALKAQEAHPDRLVLQVQTVLQDHQGRKDHEESQVGCVNLTTEYIE